MKYRSFYINEQEVNDGISPKSFGLSIAAESLLDKQLLIDMNNSCDNAGIYAIYSVILDELLIYFNTLDDLLEFILRWA